MSQRQEVDPPLGLLLLTLNTPSLLVFKGELGQLLAGPVVRGPLDPEMILISSKTCRVGHKAGPPDHHRKRMFPLNLKASEEDLKKFQTPDSP